MSGLCYWHLVTRKFEMLRLLQHLGQQTNWTVPSRCQKSPFEKHKHLDQPGPALQDWASPPKEQDGVDSWVCKQEWRLGRQSAMSTKRSFSAGCHVAHFLLKRLLPEYFQLSP